MDLLRQLLGIGIVFVLLAAVLWALRQKGRLHFAGIVSTRKIVRRLELAERVALTPHHSLHVIRVSNRALIVGAHPQGLRVLANIAWNELESE